MLWRPFVLLWWGVLSSLLFATPATNKIEILAKQIETTGDQTVAREGVVVYYNDAVMTAKRAIFDRKKRELVLEGDITAIGYNGIKEHAKSVRIKTEEKSVLFRDLFLASSNDIWIYSKKAQRTEGNYTLEESTLSSCDVSDPLWELHFSHSFYNADQQYMQLYNTKVYFMDIPIFYFPYLAFSTNRERTSGLLFPVIGYTETEGLMYEQPLYWAIHPSMDLELNPQVRTKRSVGLYGTFRFVDSPTSQGALRAGYFRDKKRYLIREDQTTNEHYGVEFNYHNKDFMATHRPSGYESALYVNMTLLNDIDYLNLQKNGLDHFGLTPLQESRVNYVLHNEHYYYGLNAKYFIDTRKENNDDTLQILPSIAFHKYLDQLFLKDLTYSFETKINHYDRKEGTTLKQVEMKLPLEYTFALFDDYLSLSLGEEFYYSKFFFDDGEFDHNAFAYYSNIHKLILFSDLTKSYSTFSHVVQPSLTYLYPGNEHAYPVSFDMLDREQQKLFTVGLPKVQYQLALSHYFYDPTTALIFYQRLSQAYYVDGPIHFSDLSNEMQYNWRNWHFYSDLSYSIAYKKIRKSSTHIATEGETYSLSLGHFYKKVLLDQPDDVVADDILVDFSYKIDDRFDIYGGLSYSLNKNFGTQWHLGGSYTRNCWSMGISLRQDVVPRPNGYTKESKVYIDLSFIPFVGIGVGK